VNERHDEQQDDAQDQVSRLLAAAAFPEDAPMPADVASRLDDVLAGLVSERAAGEAGAEERAEPVPAGEVTGATRLGSARGRRRWPQLLVAAAAVSVVGIGVTTLGTGTGSDSGSESAGGAATVQDRADQDGAVRGGAATSAPSEEKAAPELTRDADVPQAQKRGRDTAATGGRSGTLDTRPPRLRTGSLTVAVQRVEDFALAVPVAERSRRWAQACVHPDTASGDEWLPVRLDGAPAVLVLRAPSGGRRTADVFTCDDARSPAASTTVDAR
jgi:hypothetical protein